MTDLQGISILIVDDEPDLRQLFVWEFRDHGIEITVAESVEAAKKLLSEERFDIVLTDVKMPDGTGVDILSFISDQKISVHKRYLMTAYNSEDIDCEDLKVDKLFKKPLKTKEVFEFLLEDFKVK